MDNQSPASFRLQSLDSLALAVYTGRDRYTIALGVDGETIEIGEEQPAESGAGTTANPPAIPADSLPATTPAAPVPATSVPAETTAGNAPAVSS
mgnify:FL=1